MKRKPPPLPDTSLWSYLHIVPCVATKNHSYYSREYEITLCVEIFEFSNLEWGGGDIKKHEVQELWSLNLDTDKIAAYHRQDLGCTVKTASGTVDNAVLMARLTEFLNSRFMLHWYGTASEELRNDTYRFDSTTCTYISTDLRKFDNIDKLLRLFLQTLCNLKNWQLLQEGHTRQSYYTNIKRAMTHTSIMCDAAFYGLIQEFTKTKIALTMP